MTTKEDLKRLREAAITLLENPVKDGAQDEVDIENLIDAVTAAAKASDHQAALDERDRLKAELQSKDELINQLNEDCRVLKSAIIKQAIRL